MYYRVGLIVFGYLWKYLIFSRSELFLLNLGGAMVITGAP
jgi:hypothetical protein